MTATATLLVTYSPPRMLAQQPVVEMEPGWRPESAHRGTLGILLPCLITFGLCVWTAVHLNINPQPTRMRLFLSKLGWLCLGMVAPEAVLWCAHDQYFEARAIREAIMKIQKDHLGVAEPDFSMHSAFFVLMGGYVVHPTPGEFQGLPVTLTPHGFALLYAQGDVKQEDLDGRLIEDKSRGYGLAKFVVCVQALWLLLQFFARLMSELPITLLELNTVVHVLCVLLTYTYWRHKPMDIRYPVVLHLDAKLAADIYFSFDGAPSGSTKESSEDAPAPPDAASGLETRHGALRTEDEKSASATPNVSPDLEKQDYTLHTEAVAPDTESCEAVQKAVLTPTGVDSISFWSHYSAFAEKPSDLGLPEKLPLQPLCSRARMLKREGSLRLEADREQRFWGFFVFFAMSYGAAHATAWSAHLPTSTEQLLWRISAVALVAGPLLFAFTGQGLIWIEAVEGKIARKLVTVCFKPLVTIAAFAVTLLIIFSRCFVVVEAFISLRSLPVGAFDVVPWANYWPHL